MALGLLVETYPILDGRLPRVELVSGPTPVEPAPRLGDGVWVKRDDLTAPGYGGNKVRKLEYLLGDAQRRGRRSVLTLGGTGSNHVLATAIYGRQLGFASTHAVLFPQPETDDVTRKGAAYASLALRAARVPAKALVPFAAAGRWIAALAGGDGAPYYIGPGGSSPVGTLGYVAAALELARQVQGGELPTPATVWVPLGSGGTAAGLLLGLRLAGLPARLHAVRVVEPMWASAAKVARLATQTAALLMRLGVELPPRARTFTAEDLDVACDQLGAGYGAPTPAAEEAVALAGDAGLTLETTYSGKTLAAMRAAGGDGPRLFWQTYCAWRGP